MNRILCLFMVPASVALLVSCAQPKADVVKDNIVAGIGTDSVQVAQAADAPLLLPVADGEYKKKDKYCDFSVEAEWPSGSDAVSSAIRKDLLAVMDKALAYSGGKRTVQAYKGETASLEKAVKHYGAGAYSLLLADSKENHKMRVETGQEVAAENGETFKEPDVMPLAIDFEIDKEDETALWCVFEVQYYSFTGGAHGLGYSSSFTYDKATGKRFTAFLKPGAAKSMQPLLRKGLKQYFSEKGEKVSDGELMSYLQIEGNEIPLPAAAPYPTSKGLEFHYGSYEIAPYAAGQPEFTISFDRVKPYLTAEAVALLGL